MITRPERRFWILDALIVCFGFVLVVSSSLLVVFEYDHDALQKTALDVLSQKMPSSSAASQVLIGSRVEDSIPQADVIKERAIVSLYLAENSIATGARGDIDNNFNDADRLIGDALHYGPFDAYLWAARYWVRTLQSGPSLSTIDALDASYETGPFEGWLASRRCRLAFNVFPLLPASLRLKVEAEFLGLLRWKNIELAAKLLTGPAWRYRTELVEKTRDVPIGSRRQLASLLSRSGYFVGIPDVDPAENIRPWRRTCERVDASNQGGICK